jgi:hypothetical protein
MRWLALREALLTAGTGPQIGSRRTSPSGDAQTVAMVDPADAAYKES